MSPKYLLVTIAMSASLISAAPAAVTFLDNPDSIVPTQNMTLHPRDGALSCQGYAATGDGKSSGWPISCPPAAYQWNIYLLNQGNQNSGNNKDSCGRGFLDNLRGTCGVITSWGCSEVGASNADSSIYFSTTIGCQPGDVQNAYWKAYQTPNMACSRSSC